MVEITLENVSKIFGKGEKSFRAIDNVSFEIKSSSFFGILGASGAGKTTLMSMIAGLETPTKGTIRFDSTVVAKDGKDLVPVEDRNVGMVFQNWALYPHLSNYENIAFPLKVKHWSNEKIHARVKGLSETLGISEVLTRRPGQVSGGQQQRVALARALAKNPSLLLLDEPFSNLDANTKDDARSLVRKIQEDLGITAIIVSHDPSDIFSLAQEVAVIEKGELIQVATPKELYERPKNLKVSGSLGNINILDGKLIRKKENYDLEISGLITINNFITSSEVLTESVNVGIRPEDLMLVPAKRSVSEFLKNRDSDEAWERLGDFTVDASNYSQGSFLISFLYNNGRSRINGISREALLPGELLTVYINKNKIKLFDAKKGDYIDTRNEIKVSQ
ncbi:MAG: ABC transporter ATP-binding protein [Nitrososphaerota archaeon]